VCVDCCLARGKQSVQECDRVACSALPLCIMGRWYVKGGSSESSPRVCSLSMDPSELGLASVGRTVHLATGTLPLNTISLLQSMDAVPSVTPLYGRRSFCFRMGDLQKEALFEVDMTFG
jgi:hypothetical protein